MRRAQKDYEDKQMTPVAAGSRPAPPNIQGEGGPTRVPDPPLTPPPTPPRGPGGPATAPPPGSGGQTEPTVIDVPAEVPPEGEVLGEGDDVEEALEDAEDAEGEEPEQA